MANFTRGRALGAVLTATLVAATAPGLSSPADALAGINGRVANPTGKVTLTWTPTYMSDDHSYTSDQALAMAKRFDLIAGMPIAFGSYSSQMRTANPNLTLIAYSNGTILGTSKGANYPEAAFAHDTTGARITLPGFDSYLMEPSNATWRAGANQMCNDRAAKGGYDGCLVDNLTLGIWSKGYVTALPVNPATGKLYTQAEYQQALIGVGDYLEAQRPDLIHTGNAIENAYRYWRSDVKSSLTAKSLPGAQMEDFLRGAQSPATAFPQGQDWLDNVDVVRDMEASGGTGLFTTKLWASATEAQVDAWQRLSMATFLMGANGHSYLAFTRSRDKAGAMGTNTPYRMPQDLGTPTGVMSQHASGAYFRTFSNGVSLANPTPSTVTVQFDAPVRTLKGESVTSVTLPANGADVLVGSGHVITVGDPDTVKPVASFSPAVTDTTGVTLSGVATDDRAVSAVAVAIRDTSTMQWLRTDGTWGGYQELPATVVGAGAPKVTWSQRFNLKPGRYGVALVATDGAANQNDTKPWQDVTVRDGSDVLAPTGTFSAVAPSGSGLSLTGTAHDDQLVHSVAVGIRNTLTGKYLRRDGSWGAYQNLAPTVTGLGTRTATWSLRASLSSGSYRAVLTVVDGAGNTSPQSSTAFKVG